MGTVTGDPVNYSAPSLSNSISPEINRGLLTLRQHLVNIPFLFLWTLPASEGINKYSSVEQRDVGSRLVLSPQLLGFLPSTVLSLSWYRPEMVMPFDRTFDSFPSPALPQQDIFLLFLLSSSPPKSTILQNWTPNMAIRCKCTACLPMKPSAYKSSKSLP